MGPTNTAQYTSGGCSNKNTLPLHGRHLFLIAVLVWSNIYIYYEAPSEQCNFLKGLWWSNAIFLERTQVSNAIFVNNSGEAMQYFFKRPW